LYKREAETLRAAFFGNPVPVYLYDYLKKVAVQAVVVEEMHWLRSVDHGLDKLLEDHMVGLQVTQ